MKRTRVLRPNKIYENVYIYYVFSGVQLVLSEIIENWLFR